MTKKPFEELDEDEEFNPQAHIFDQIQLMEDEGYDKEKIIGVLTDLFKELGHDDEAAGRFALKFYANHQISKMNKP